MRSKAARRDADAPAADVFLMDTGAANVRARYVRHSVHMQAPVVSVPNAIGRTRPGTRKQVLLADQIETDCHDYGGLQLRLPIERGLVVDWPAQKAIWDRLLQITADSGKHASFDSFHALSGNVVVATEPYFNLPDQQRALETLLFDWYGADAIWCTTPAQLAPFAPSLYRGKGTGARSSQQPECMLVVDCGHSYTHAVPVVLNEAVWPAARRLDLGGRVLTNVLKEMFSFRQWNMMEETYLTDKMKPRSFFVAARATDDGDSAQPERPCDWSFTSLVERFHKEPDNALLQRYVLPDYAQMEDARNPETKYGHIVSGPGSKENPTTAKALSEEDALDVFIAGRQHCNGTTPSQRAARAHAHDDESQILTLGQERYLLFEFLFAPQRLGLQQGSLPELVEQSISRVDERYRELLWANVVLIGGVAQVPGLRRRLARELRTLAPDDVPVNVTMLDEPELAALNGGAALAEAPSGSREAKFLHEHLLTREAWLKSSADGAPCGAWNSPRYPAGAYAPRE